nr:MAG TPA: hypothetical protein [Caudoviricetes sp.]
MSSPVWGRGLKENTTRQKETALFGLSLLFA